MALDDKLLFLNSLSADGWMTFTMAYETEALVSLKWTTFSRLPVCAAAAAEVAPLRLPPRSNGRNRM